MKSLLLSAIYEDLSKHIGYIDRRLKASYLMALDAISILYIDNTIAKSLLIASIRNEVVDGDSHISLYVHPGIRGIIGDIEYCPTILQPSININYSDLNMNRIIYDAIRSKARELKSAILIYKKDVATGKRYNAYIKLDNCQVFNRQM